MNQLKIHFSDYFGVDETTINDYGAINISLISDLPLFVDPFLLFNSDKKDYQKIHSEIIKYLLFLQKQSYNYSKGSSGIINAWYHFPEVKQTWLGFSKKGNAGKGLGLVFGSDLHKGLRSIFKDFGNETLTQSSHLEKLCLISPLVGRDKISDFTTNFVKKLLLQYTMQFAKRYLKSSQCKLVKVDRVQFNYNTNSWESGEYYLPWYGEDYVLLTPRDILTKDETFINRDDMISNLERIGVSIGDESLRFLLNQYFTSVLGKRLSKEEKSKAALGLISQNPSLIDYYIKYKEDHSEEANIISEKNVADVELLFCAQLRELAQLLDKHTNFYASNISSYEEAYSRVLYMKKVIEDMDGYKYFYVDGKPVHKENDLQIMYKLVWYASGFDVNREVNNGRGPVDFKISMGAKDTTLVEFKLASNSKLRNNLKNQVEVYKKANCTDKAIKVILFFTEVECNKVIKILKELELENCKEIVLIDATDNKISASNVR